MVRLRSAPNAIVWLAFGIVKRRLTLGAARCASFPACAAVIVHVPTPVRCTVVPMTVQRPAAVSDTGRPEVAVTATVKSAVPHVLLGRGAT